MGIPEREVEALMRASDPDFDEEDYGFQEFGELLNGFGQGLGSSRGRLERDATLRPGSATVSRRSGRSATTRVHLPPPHLRQAVAHGGPRRRRRRPRRRNRASATPAASAWRSSRGEGGHRNDESAPEGLPRDVDEDEQDALEAAEESKAPEPKQKPEPEPKPKAESEPAQEDDDEEPAEKEVEKPSRKKAAKKKAARKKATRKKAAKKKAARKDDEVDRS
ncbi:MAG: hypothetical protein R2724_05160 [Bryobacterales bacterium]